METWLWLHQHHAGAEHILRWAARSDLAAVDAVPPAHTLRPSSLLPVLPAEATSAICRLQRTPAPPHFTGPWTSVSCLPPIPASRSLLIPQAAHARGRGGGCGEPRGHTEPVSEIPGPCRPTASHVALVVTWTSATSSSTETHGDTGAPPCRGSRHPWVLGAPGALRAHVTAVSSAPTRPARLPHPPARLPHPHQEPKPRSLFSL